MNSMSDTIYVSWPRNIAWVDAIPFSFFTARPGPVQHDMLDMEGGDRATAKAVLSREHGHIELKYERNSDWYEGTLRLWMDGDRPRAIWLDRNNRRSAHQPIVVFLPSDTNAIDAGLDARTWVRKLIALRQGQNEFRNKLLTAYDGRCAISGCGVAAVLEAAHICPYRGMQTNRVDNGLLLRADLHALFDARLLRINRDYRVEISRSLLGTDYRQFNGQRLRLPSERQRPNPAHLEAHAREAIGGWD